MLRVFRRNKRKSKKARRGFLRRVFAVLRFGVKLGAVVAVIIMATVLAFRWINPPMTLLMQREAAERGEIAWEWRSMSQISPDFALSVVAAEDANFCLHYGFDIEAIRAALDDGAERGASTISQQVAKNLFLWPERSWLRKGLEVGFTGLIELFWPKQRILEVYLNIAEMGPGVFGAEAAAQHHYRQAAIELGPSRAAALAVILPNPRERDPRNPTSSRARRAAQVADGAATLQADGRAACFLPN